MSDRSFEEVYEPVRFDFQECSACRQKLGSPLLCDACVKNRNTIAELENIAEKEFERRKEWQRMQAETTTKLQRVIAEKHELYTLFRYLLKGG